MSEKVTKKLYKNKNIETETYTQDDAVITKHYYNDKNNHVRERILIKGDSKEVNSFTKEGVFSKSENFLNDLRDGIETRYVVSKANKSIKSTKTYAKGKLHGESITYNLNDQIIKQEVFALGKLVFKYIRDEDLEIIGIEIVAKESVDNLPVTERDTLNAFMATKPEWFTK